MWDDEICNSQYYSWWRQHRIPFPEPNQEHAEQALRLIIEGIRNGEITFLDGECSPLTQRLKEHHQIDTLEMNSNWITTPQQWRCPCCNRTKFEISRIGSKGQILAKLVIHHDHMNDALKAAFHEEFVRSGNTEAQVNGLKLVDRIGPAFAAYEEVLICEDCNNIDASAKKHIGAPKFFSFSVGQLKKFIVPAPHSAHGLDPSALQTTWAKAEPAYELRMALISKIVKAAVSAEGWFEPFPYNTPAIPTYGASLFLTSPAIRAYVSAETLIKNLGPGKTAKPNLSRWRTTRPKAAGKLPPNFEAILRSDPHRNLVWNSVPEDWICPVCARQKLDVVYINNKNEPAFVLKDTSGRGFWKDVTYVCNHCESILKSLKLEVDSKTAIPSKLFELVFPCELKSIIRPHPHSPHHVDEQSAAELVSQVIEVKLFA